MADTITATVSGQPAAADADAGALPVPRFPGRATTGVCMVVAPLALAVLCLLATDIYKFHGHDFLAAMAANHIRTEVFLNAVPIGIFLLIVAVVGLATMAAQRGARLANAGGVLAVLGLLGPVFFVAIEFCGYQLSSAQHLAAGAHMYDQANMVPRLSLNISGPAIIVGFILLAVAAHRGRVLSKASAIAFGFTALLPIGFIAAVLPISAVGFLACAIALVPLGVKLLQHPATAPV